MKLRAFLGQSNLSQTGLAELAQTTQKTISLLVNEEGATNVATAARIEQATLGLVQAGEVPLHPEDKAALLYLRPNGPRKTT